jgi:hypothetical protein
MAKISVSYQKRWWSGGHSNILIDGKRIGKVRSGTSETYEITPGNHNLRVDQAQGLVTLEIFDRVRLFGDTGTDFSLSGNEEIKFMVKRTRFSYFYAAFFIPAMLCLVFAKELFKTDHLLVPIIIFILYMYLISFLFKGKLLKTEVMGRHEIKSSSE